MQSYLFLEWILFFYISVRLILNTLLNGTLSPSKGKTTPRKFFEARALVHFCSVVSDSLRPHGLQLSMPSCPSQLPDITQTHVHRVSDAIQPSHPLSSPSPPAFDLSQHQGLFKRVSSSHQVAKLLEFQLQHQSFQWIFRNDFL